MIAATIANESLEICQQGCCEHVGGDASDNHGSFDLPAISCGFVADRQGNAFSDECKIGATAVVPGDLATPQTAPGVTMDRGAIGLASGTHAEAIWIKQRSLRLESGPDGGGESKSRVGLVVMKVEPMARRAFTMSVASFSKSTAERSCLRADQLPPWAEQ